MMQQMHCGRQPAAAPARGSKRVGSDAAPQAQAPAAVQVGFRTYDLRLWDDKHGDFDIEAVLTCNVVPGPPTAWQPKPSEQEGSAIQVDEAGAWSLAAGAPCLFLLELVDAHGNMCAPELCTMAVHKW